jgi:hypothetical protein
MYTLKDGTEVISIPDHYTGKATTEMGTTIWYRYGKYHRLDGPAWEGAYGSKWWWINDKQIFKLAKLILIQRG